MNIYQRFTSCVAASARIASTYSAVSSMDVFRTVLWVGTGQCDARQDRLIVVYCDHVHNYGIDFKMKWSEKVLGRN